MRFSVVPVVLLAGTDACPLFAQTTAPVETYIHAGRLLDRPGTAPRGPSTLIVRAGKIAEVRVGLVAPPAGVRLIDLSSKFVLPGLIDSHVHLRSDTGGVAGFVEGMTMSEAAGAFVTADNARKTLMATSLPYLF